MLKFREAQSAATFELRTWTPNRMEFTNPPRDPVAACERWFQDMREQTDLPNPNAMTVATVAADGRPSARTVLLKAFDARGAVFYTNSESRKGVELAGHPVASLLFHWDILERQIRIEGGVTQVDAAESDAYFASRRRESQRRWASKQSRPFAARAEFDQAYAEVEAVSKVGMSNGLRIGTATGWPWSGSSSGRVVMRVCMTDSSTPQRPMAGRPHSCIPDRIQDTSSSSSRIASAIKSSGNG